MQLPIVTVTAPSAWRARRPVSIVTCLPSPISKILRIGCVSIESLKFEVCGFDSRFGSLVDLGLRSSSADQGSFRY
jgi:hypothetical protein